MPKTQALILQEDTYLINPPASLIASNKQRPGLGLDHDQALMTFEGTRR